MLDRNKLDRLLNEYGSLVWNKWNAPEDDVYIGRGSLYGKSDSSVKSERRRRTSQMHRSVLSLSDQSTEI